MQKEPKPVKMAEKMQKIVFFLQIYLLFTKNVVTLPQIFRKSRLKKTNV